MTNEIIMVVDDNRQIADLTAEHILPSLGYRTIVAYTGRSALAMIRQRHAEISLMLVDLQMPDYSGLDLLRKLQEEGLGIPAILVTAHGSEQVAVGAFRLGVQDYLNKPVEVDELRDAIARALTVTRLRQERNTLMTQLQDQVSWLTALSNVGRSLTSTLSVNKVLRRIVEAGVMLTRADQGFLALADNDSDRLYLRAVKNIDEEKIDTFRLPVNDTDIGEVFGTGKPVRKTKSAREPRLKVSTGFLVYSFIHVPIALKGKILGVLSVNNHASIRSFSEKDEAVLISLADYAAIAIENANLYEQAQDEIRERRKVELALRESEERYALSVRGANDGIWDWDLKTNKIYFSPRWKAILGYEADEIGDDPNEWFDRIHPEDGEHIRLSISTHIKGRTSHFVSEYRMRNRNGGYAWVLCRGIAVWNATGGAVRMTGSLSDINDRKLAEQRLQFDAFHDALTGLPNRALFLDRLRQAVERHKRNSDFLFAVLFLDLDHFKDINDSLGHVLGDHFLAEVASILSKGLRSTDTLARFGGDEFIILLEDLVDYSNVARVVNWIQQKFSKPISTHGHEVFSTTSIGIVQGSSQYQNPEDVIRDADIAMYVAKARGRNRAETFEPGMRKRILQRLRMETELRKALENDELRVYYQPIVQLESNQLIGFEALARWQHPELGILQPIEFVPLAEETGMIIALDRWMLKHACRQMSSWQQRYKMDPPLTISVNISGKHIATQDLADYVADLLEQTGLNPDSLKLEITERTIIDYNDITAGIFSNLQKLGVQIQIDDFGIGYSSLGYLSRFPVNALKIDRSFVEKIVDSTSQREIVQAIVTLTGRLNVRVIAEGVETIEQLQELRKLGCELGQGFLVATPMDNGDVEELLLAISKGTGDLGSWKVSKQSK
ncbi:MAG: EAL domain-containing protein [Anaerolineales bacterium]|nr:EAL domain-containing protein [Anaerolineales bacterium]